MPSQGVFRAVSVAQKESSVELFSFFVGLSNPHNESYEIGHVGHRASDTQ